MLAAWARTLVRFGATTAGDGTAAGRWPNALYFNWSGSRIGGNLVSVSANTSGDDPYLYETGKATLTGLLMRAGQQTGDAAVTQRGTDLIYLSLNSALSDDSPLGKIQGEYQARLHAAIARSNTGSPPGSTPTATLTSSATPTTTHTPTATATATPTSASVPAVPTLLAPANHVRLTTPRVTLDWTDSSGATRYQVQVRRGSMAGALVVNKQVTGSQYRTANLPRGKYFWQVRACRSSVCSAWSAFWDFTVQ